MSYYVFVQKRKQLVLLIMLAGIGFAEGDQRLKEPTSEEREQKLYELMNDKALFAVGEPHIYRNEYLFELDFPVGGIAAGSIHMNGKAERHRWHIFNNRTYGCRVPHSFFAVRVSQGRSRPVVRVLQMVPMGPFSPMEALTFQAKYPFGWYEFKDPNLNVEVGLEVFNPLIPMDIKNSGIPAIIYKITVHNIGKEPADISLLATQQNAVGYTGRVDFNEVKHIDYGGNMNTLIKDERSLLLHMTSRMPRGWRGWGDMVLGVLDGGAQGIVSWENMDSLHESFTQNGLLDGPEKMIRPTETGESVAGALVVPFKLEPKETYTACFLLTWYFPNAFHGEGAYPSWPATGNQYCNWWKDALEIAYYTRDNIEQLSAQTRQYVDSFYATNMPTWLLDRISAQNAILRTGVVYWARNGYFGAYEGLSNGYGCCWGNCTHVWHYAQSHARLYPVIARLMREQDLNRMKPNGAIPIRHDDSLPPAVDGQCGDVLGAYREHLMTADGAWLNTYWPKIKKATDFIISEWDGDEDGILHGAQDTTLDCSVSGNTSWLGTMYLAALAAGEEMARIEDDKAAEQRYHQIRLSGQVQQNETLWNGEYYVQIPDAERARDYENGCHIDQLLGQWWANQVNLGWLYPPERVRAAMKALFRHNFRTDFISFEQKPRSFVDAHQQGMIMITWPYDDRPKNFTTYSDEIWTGTEYSAAATMIQAGLLQEGFTVLKAVSDRTDGRLARSGPFNDVECGWFYSRAQSIWSVILALQGYLYDGPAGKIGFKPLWRPHDHVSFFTAADSWGNFLQKRDNRFQQEVIDLKWGKLRIENLIFELPANTPPARSRVLKKEQQLPSTSRRNGREITIELNEPVLLWAGERLQIVFEWD